MSPLSPGLTSAAETLIHHLSLSMRTRAEVQDLYSRHPRDQRP
jgi:hypothetical protein